MANAKKKPADEKKAPGGKPQKSKKGGKLGLYSTLVVAGFAAPFMFPTLVLASIGMVPTLVAFFVDKDRQHSSATAVGAMNCAGLTPFVIDLWIKGQSMGNVFQILADPGNWLIILGSAAIGQTIVSVVPQALATLTLVHSEIRVKTLKGHLDQLRSSWGPDVGTTKSVDDLAQME